ncbi:hypothetical protein Ciccas_001076 [Cichlidogyrus casuarinus]|uniref:non-specific serine/threonine protein kinase n=1 Tax=Cichlidogyrus casuarinus TaxID=1844966 RepID=A0ABD2QL61_9PLAT
MSCETYSFKPLTTAITKDYTISETVFGSGVNGKVYKCIDKKTQIEYALKILPDTSKSRREIELHKRCSELSRHIVKIVKVYENNNMNTKKNYLLIVMESMSGGELFQRIQQHADSPFTEREAACIVYQIASAVNDIHSLNIAHRDLKPENLLYASDAPDALLKLTDFGFAKELQKDVTLSTPCYTPYYVAPEVLGPENYDQSCDMWSLGVITYILLCGYPPFYSHNGQPISPGMKRRIRLGEYTFPTREWTRVSGDAKDLISKLLMVDPSQRLNISEVMAHEWITKHNAVPDTPLLTRTILLEDSENLEFVNEAWDQHLMEIRGDDNGVKIKTVSDANNSLLHKRRQKKEELMESA